jgi:hypothetical protein
MEVKGKLIDNIVLKEIKQFLKIQNPNVAVGILIEKVT